MTHAPETQAAATERAGAPAGAPGAAVPGRPATGMAIFTAGTIFPQFFVLLFVNIAFFMGAVLPWNGTANLTTGLYTFPGAFIGFVSLGGVIASLSSIFSQRLVIWPTLLTWIIADCFVVAKILSIVRDNGETFSKMFSADFKEGLTEMGAIVGPGFVFILLAAVFMLLFLITSVFSGAKAQAKKKEAQKQARTSSRKDPKK